MPAAKVQPKPGDKVAFCPHYGQHKQWQWYALPNGREMHNQIGQRELVTWAVACIDCLNAVGGDILKVRFGGVGTWQGRGSPIEAAGKPS